MPISADAVAQRLANGIIKVQRNVANYLNNWAEKLDRRVLLAIFLFFGILAASYSLWLVLRSLG